MCISPDACLENGRFPDTLPTPIVATNVGYTPRIVAVNLGNFRPMFAGRAPDVCKPLQVWVGAIFMFVIGIFAPVFGENEFFDTGWKIWQVGGLMSLAGWIITWFWDIR